MSEAQNEGDEDFRTQSKFKQFSSAVDRALKAFELSTEWHDLISALAKLNKVLLAYMQYPVVPHHLTVCKRLTQCLHPNLPSGVHLKTLDVYQAIFDRIGPSGLSSDLLAYSSGLFPLITYSSMTVRSQVIDMYEKYYIPLGERLRPALHGLVLGLLPGLEDGSEHRERINCLLNALCETIDLSFFSSALWQCIVSSAEARVSASNFILSKLDKRLTAEDQVHMLGGNLPIMVSAICAGLTDKNILSVRSMLDILILLFPLHRPFLLPSDVTAIMVAALEALLKRDISLNRRLFSWLLGSSVDKATLPNLPRQHAVDQSASDNSEIGYFRAYSASYVQSALKKLCVQVVLATKRSSASKPDCIQLYRLLRALLERIEISLLDDVLMDVVSCLMEQVESLGGFGADQQLDRGSRKTPSDDHPKKLGRRVALKLEIMQSANLFFNALNPGFLWEWLCGLLQAALTNEVGADVCREESHTHFDVSESDVMESEPLEDVFVNMDSPVLRIPPNLSPVVSTVERREGTSSKLKRTHSAERLSCAKVIGMTKFLLKSLPLDSIENAHLVHLPRLSLIILSCLSHSNSSLTTHELEITLDLVSCIIHELMSSPSSRAATPATPLSVQDATLFSAGDVTPGKSPTPVDRNSPTNSLEQLACEIMEAYLQFFGGFVRESAVASGDKGSVFSTVCQLLVLIARFGATLEWAFSEPQNSPWIDSLTAACSPDCASPDHHVTFVGLETVLKLLQLHSLHEHAVGFPGSESEPSVTAVLITQPLLHHLSSNQAFVRSVTEFLWSCLSHSHPSYHFEASTLLSWLHEQLSMPSIFETVVLEHFTVYGLEAHRCFAVLWEHSPPASCSARFLCRCVLRMLEGLKSDSPSVRLFVESWVSFTLAREGDLQALLQPLVRILASPSLLRKPFLAPESKTYHKEMELSEKDARKDKAYAKYYYESLGIPDPMDFAKTGQHCETMCYYSQVIDTSQLLYALSLLQSTINVDPFTIVSYMGRLFIEPVSYCGKDRSGTTEDPGKDEPVVRKSLLELIISLCVDLARSEYPSTLEASLSHHLDNLRVRMSSVEVLCCLTGHLARLSAEAHSVDGGTTVPLSTSFVSALITLCDVQKTALLVLGLVVRDLRGFKKNDSQQKCHTWTKLPSNGSSGASLNPEFTLQSFFTQLLMLVYTLVALETQCHSKQALTVITPTSASPQSSGLKGCSEEWLPPIQPTLPTASQPFLLMLILDILTDSHLAHLHQSLLNFTSALLPNLLDHQLADLASKLLKQICSNLEKLHKPKQTTTNEPVCILYLNTLCSILSWCLFGETKLPREEAKPGQRTINSFWKQIRVADIEEHGSHLSPTHRQPSTMSWLLSVFSTPAQTGAKLLTNSDEEDGRQGLFSRSRVGVGSRAGQHVLMLLPAVYNAVTEVWKEFGHRGKGVEFPGHALLRGDVARKKTFLEGQEVIQLVSQLMSGLAHREPSAFFSSISHVWMEWVSAHHSSLQAVTMVKVLLDQKQKNLETGSEVGRRRNKRRGIFIEMLHHIKALPLGGIIDSIQTTLSEIRLAEERVSGLLRQKYLLHFLYKYISSTLLSSEELADCSGQVVTFLRDLLSDYLISTPDQQHNTCHILCMLTSILHVVVCRVPAPDAKKQKKERKELQDLIHKLCEALSLAASTGLPKQSVKYHKTSHDNPITQLPNDQGNSGVSIPESNSTPSAIPGTYSPVHVSGKPIITLPSGSHSDSELIGKRDDGVPRSMAASEILVAREETPNTLPTLQALAVLSNVLSHFVDCAFEGSEKDKVIALLKAILSNVWLHLQIHSLEMEQPYLHTVKLLSSLSGFQVSRRAWRKEALELFLAPSFFQVGTSALREWRVIVDNLMTQDHVTFRDLLSKVHPSNTAGVVNIFISVDQEVAAGARLLKRMAFALFAAETDQFVELLPDIQERLSEYLKVLRHPPICATVALVFRVLLLRFSPSHLMAFWPAITSEMLSLLSDLETDLSREAFDEVSLSTEKLQLHLAVCKLLDTAMALPTDHLPHFQLLRWGFLSHNTPPNSEEHVVTKLCRQFKVLGSPNLEALHTHYTPHSTPPYLQSPSISSLRELKPLFTALSQTLADRELPHSPHVAVGSQYSQTDKAQKSLKRIEAVLLSDFIESQ